MGCGGFGVGRHLGSGPRHPHLLSPPHRRVDPHTVRDGLLGETISKEAIQLTGKIERTILADGRMVGIQLAVVAKTVMDCAELILLPGSSGGPDTAPEIKRNANGEHTVELPLRPPNPRHRQSSTDLSLAIEVTLSLSSYNIEAL